MNRSMNRVLAVARTDPAGVPAVAQSWANVLAAAVRTLGVADAPEASDVQRVLAELADDATTLAVLPDGNLERLAWPVLRSADKPVVIVPGGYRPPPAVGRALVPLDGTPESAAAIAGTVELLARAGVDLVALHVFHADTVPPFWDHPGGADELWEQEFLARYCDHPGIRLQVRSGSPGERVLDVAATEQVDLIALGWSQQLDRGRARTLRHTVRHSPVPVLIVPVRALG